MKELEPFKFVFVFLSFVYGERQGKASCCFIFIFDVFGIWAEGGIWGGGVVLYYLLFYFYY